MRSHGMHSRSEVREKRCRITSTLSASYNSASSQPTVLPKTNPYEEPSSGDDSVFCRGRRRLCRIFEQDHDDRSERGWRGGADGHVDFGERGTDSVGVDVHRFQVEPDRTDVELGEG